MISCYHLAKKFEPEVKIREPKEYKFTRFLKEIHTNNFGIFTLFSVLIYFSVFIIGPLMVLYWLKYLNFSYMQLTVVISVASITSFVTTSYWGANADHYGNKLILLVTSKMLAVIPFLWYLIYFAKTENIYTYAIFIQAIAGFAWAGFSISSSNLMYEFVEPINRIRLFSYHNALQGIAIFIGSTVGGILAGITFSNPTLLKFFPFGILFVLMISTITLIIIIAFFHNKIFELKELKQKPHFLHFMTIMPIQGIIFDSVVGMNRTVKRFKEKLLKIEKNLDYLEEDYKKKTKN